MSKSTRFAVFDIDGTFFRSSLYFEVVKKLVSEGHLSDELGKSIDESYRNWRQKHDDESFWAYADVIMTAHEGNLPQLQIEHFEEAVKSVLGEQREHVYTFTKSLAKSLKNKGYLLFAISGSQHEIVEQFCKYHGFDNSLGSIHERDTDGKQFTGSSTVTHKDKTELLNSLVIKHNATFEGSIGVGDTHGDITILDMVESPIAFNPNSKLYTHATSNGWKLVFERKDVIIELEKSNQGYLLANKSL